MKGPLQYVSDKLKLHSLSQRKVYTVKCKKCSVYWGRSNIIVLCVYTVWILIWKQLLGTVCRGNANCSFTLWNIMMISTHFCHPSKRKVYNETSEASDTFGLFQWLILPWELLKWTTLQLMLLLIQNICFVQMESFYISQQPTLHLI